MIFHILTAVLFVLKVLGMIEISWWLVLAPSIVVIVFALVMLVGAVVLGICPFGCDCPHIAQAAIDGGKGVRGGQ